MDKDYFMNVGESQHLESSMPYPWSGLNDHQSFLGPTSSMDHYSHFDSTWSSMASTTPAAATTSAAALRQLIGKLSPAGNSGSFPAANPHQISIPNLPLTPPLPSLSSDPGFAERAAKFSCFGSRSFNGRTSQLGLNNGESGRKLTGPLHRVSSSPSLNHHNGSSTPIENNRASKPFPGSDANSNEESSVSEQIPSGESGSKTSNELNSRKRKAISRGKRKEDRTTKGLDGEDDGNAKRLKASETGKNEEDTNDENEKQKTNQKPPEPPKDYIHVRARRGQATDSHSLAERVRREKISERMKLLQDLVPGCNKVTGKALMLDEIINYVQSLQRQVEFLSMKLASVNPGLDFNMDNLLSKDMFQQNASLPQQMYPLDSSGPAFYHHQSQQSVPLSQNPVEPTPFDAPPCRNLAIQLASVDGFGEGLSQFPDFSEDDLHSIVQMGFVQNHVSFSAQNQASSMKVEL